ncbi:hypothetical protein B0J17DRAFT_621772 [Rhizoctonia solani]|nr:hypothetical protein B0J17DRAFT_621772 [Rhizoctonia solani]
MNITEFGADTGPFGGHPKEDNRSRFSSPSPNRPYRSSEKKRTDIDSGSDMNSHMFRNSDNRKLIYDSRPTQRASSRKVEPLSTPPSTPPSSKTRSNTYNPRARIVSPSPISQPTPPRPSPFSQRVPVNVVQRILAGEQHSATFEGTSQYAAGGTSACGLASMNAIRLAFDLSSKMTDAERLVTALVSEEFVRAAMGIATYWPSDMHLEVEPILQLPLFSSAIQALDDRYAECTYQTFSNAVIALRFDDNSPGPRAVCMTRPPEVISVMHIPITRSTNNDRPPWLADHRATSIYLIFDSHPRSNHPHGAAIHVFPSQRREDVAQYLMDLFQVDQEIINDPSLEWTAQLFGQLSYHLLAPIKSGENLDVYALNMRILEADHNCSSVEDKLRAVEAEARLLRTQVFEIEQEAARLSFNTQRIQHEVQHLKIQLARECRPPPSEQAGRSPWFSIGGQISESSGSKDRGKGRDNAASWQASPARKEANEFPSKLADNYKREDSNGSLNRRSGDTGGSRSSANTRTSNAASLQYSQQGGTVSRPPPVHTPALPKIPGSARRQKTAAEIEEARSLELALRLQQEFDHETSQITLGEALAKSMEQRQFECMICMETCPDEDIARIDGCEHSCCRDCMRGHIQSKVEERRYPIPCPLCVAAPDGNHEQQPGIGTIPAWVVETIGISPELFNIYTEMQLAEHSIVVECRGCSNSVFVDREEHAGAETITCPLPECNHKWCKQCSQTIQDGIKHTCDGSAELENLMHEQGWKHCPGCRTPIERTQGCAYMTCKTPGCNTHFCYKCGNKCPDHNCPCGL